MDRFLKNIDCHNSCIPWLHNQIRVSTRIPEHQNFPLLFILNSWQITSLVKKLIKRFGNLHSRKKNQVSMYEKNSNCHCWFQDEGTHVQRPVRIGATGNLWLAARRKQGHQSYNCQGLSLVNNLKELFFFGPFSLDAALQQHYSLVRPISDSQTTKL